MDSSTDQSAPSKFLAPLRRRRVWGLALPIIGGMLSQNILNLVDAAMVGSLGDVALAAVGLGGFLNFLLSAFITGLSAGVQAIAARRKGEGESQTAIPLNGGLVLAAALAIPWSMLLVWLAPYFFPWVVDDVAVVDTGVPYLRLRLVAMVALGMNFAFRGYWNAVDKSMLYMRTLIVMHAANILFNWIFIFGHLGVPPMGAAGAGLGSAISTFIGTAMYFFLGRRHASTAGFLSSLPSMKVLRSMLKLAIPSGIQQVFFAGGMTCFMVIIGKIGTAELAASKVVVDLLLVAILPGIGFGISAATLVGQALGRKDAGDAERWGWEVATLGSIAVALIALPAVAFPDAILSPFIHDPDTRALAHLPIRLLGLSMGFDVFGTILMNALIGAGDTKTAMRVSVLLQWGCFLPAAFLLGPSQGLLWVWVANILYRSVQSGIFVWLWRRGHWKSLKV